MTRRNMRWMVGLGFLLLAACGGSSTCKRACRKAESCLTQRPGGVGTTQGAGTTPSSTCDGIDSCDEKAACQASCLLQSTCDEIAAGSAALSACLGQCHTVVIPTGNDAGLVKPLTRDGGWSCTPDCAGKQCGDDGCGGSCGTCVYGAVCSWGTCASSCTPNCSGAQCGDDGCGGSCGSCGPGQTCSYGSCASTSSNSGALCSQSTSCSGTDACMVFDEYAVSGMCLGACATVGDLCATSGSMLSVCALSSQSTGQLYCVFICELQGSSYPCPNSLDYACKVFDTTRPDVKLCMPK